MFLKVKIEILFSTIPALFTKGVLGFCIFRMHYSVSTSYISLRLLRCTKIKCLIWNSRIHFTWYCCDWSFKAAPLSFNSCKWASLLVQDSKTNCVFFALYWNNDALLQSTWISTLVHTTRQLHQPHSDSVINNTPPMRRRNTHDIILNAVFLLSSHEKCAAVTSWSSKQRCLSCKVCMKAIITVQV